MLQSFSKYAGMAQTAIGLLSQLAPGSIGSMLGAQAQTSAGDILGGGNLVNVLSGAALSYLGFKGTANNQRMGAQVLGGLNGLVGLLGVFGKHDLGGLQLTNDSWISVAINLIIGAWGLYSGFAKKPAAATAH